jgi:hypothetical protein
VAQNFCSLSLLILPNEAPPQFDSADAIFEYHESKRYGKSAHGIINYVMTDSRKNSLLESVERLCRTAAVDDLSFLYSADEKRAEWRFEETIEEGQPWCLWAARMLNRDEMLRSVAAISALFEWSQAHIPLLAAKDFLGYFANEHEVGTAINAPVITTEPTLDEAVPYRDDGDGPWCLYSFLGSLQTLMRHAIEGNASVLHIMQLPLKAYYSWI